MEENKINILEELSKKRPMIDKIIEKYIPRKYDEKSLEFVIGKSIYKHSPNALTKAISEPVWDFLDRKGKRWRPALFLIVCEALGKDPEDIVDLAIIPELIHNGTLVHDDIEDGSLNRRGLPCMHIKFGMDVSINVGDALYYLSILSVLKNKDKFDTETLIKLYEVYFQEMLRVTFGQGTDIVWHKGMADADSITEAEYLQMCSNKTGCLARMSAKLAAAACGASDEQIEKIGHFAGTIGVAFQIQDDILNVAGKKDVFTKDIGEDITEGKRTLMVIRTLEKANEEDKKRLLEILKMHTKETELIKEAVDILNKYDSVNYARKVAKEMMENAWGEIDKILPASDAKQKLHAFAKFLIEREL